MPKLIVLNLDDGLLSFPGLDMLPQSILNCIGARLLKVYNCSTDKQIFTEHPYVHGTVLGPLEQCCPKEMRVSNFKLSSSHTLKRETCDINFNDLFYLTQYI